MIEGGEPLVWSYRRIGRDWVPEAPFPALALDGALEPFVSSSWWYSTEGLPVTCLELDGQTAYVCATASELEFDGTSWVVTHQGPSDYTAAVDLEAGVALGFVPGIGHSVLRRGPSGWEFEDSIPVGTFSWAMDIEGDLAVVGDPIEPFGPFGVWQGQFWIYQRDPASGSWVEAAYFPSDSGVESVRGANVFLSDGTVFVSDSGALRMYERSPGGTWGIGPSVGSMILPAPPGAWLLATGSLTRPVVDGNVVFGRRVWNAATGVQLTRYDRGADGSWSPRAWYPLDGASWCDFDGDGELAIGRVASYRLFDTDDAPVGVLAPVQGPDGCLAGVQVFEPVISARTCPGVPTSTGATATLDLVGSFFRADERTVLAASRLPAWTFATPLFSTAPGLTVAPAGSVGNLCLDHPITRLLWHSGQADGAGQFSCDIDVDNGLGGTVVPIGTSTYFQVWFRDFDANGVPTSNYTNGCLMRAW
ncbi:MAG: hypothetical protein AAFR54_12025 [Planctomycetota bacterium]